MNSEQEKRNSYPVAFILIALFVLQVNGLISYHSLTTDEMAHTVAGIYYLKTGNFQDGFDNPPLLQLLYGLPYAIGGLEFDTIGSEPPIAARYVNLFLGTLLAFSVYLFSMRVHGPRGAILSLFFIVSSPTIIAHSSITTTDIGMTLFLVLFCFALWYAHKQSSFASSALAACFLALAVSAKFTALSFLPFAFFISVLSPHWTERKRNDVLKELLIFVVVVWFVFCLFYKFEGCFSVKSGKYGTWLSYLGIPFPELAVKSFGEKLLLSGSNLPLHYYLGFSRETIRWIYYPTILFFKMPLGSLLFFLYALVCLCLKQWKPSKSHLYILLPALVFYLSMATNRFHDGVRHLIPALVLFYLGLGATLPQMLTKNKSYTYLIALTVILNVLSCQHCYPLYMSTFNWITAVASEAPFPASGADVDYAQDDGVVKKYLLDQRDSEKIFLCPYPSTRPRVGQVLINCSAWALFVSSGPGFRWLEGFQPKRYLGGSWLLYEVTEEMYKKRARDNRGNWAMQWPLFEYLLWEGKIDELFYETEEGLKTFRETGIYRIRALIYANRLHDALQEFDRLEKRYGPYPMSIQRWRYIIYELLGKGQGPRSQQAARALLSLRELEAIRLEKFWQQRTKKENYFQDVKLDEPNVDLRIIRAHLLFEAGKFKEAAEFYKSLGELLRKVPVLAMRSRQCFEYLRWRKKDERKLMTLVFDRVFAAEIPKVALSLNDELHTKYPNDYYVTSGYHWLAGWQRRGLLAITLPRKSIFDSVDAETGRYMRR